MRRFEYWTVAYRRRKDRETILENTEEPFVAIKNTWRYWAADPHVVEHGGRTYIFAELYDRLLRRGVIGCCEVGENGVTPWRVVLRMPYHLSYPQVVRRGDCFYMIPESYVAEEIAVFRAKHFPDLWEKVSVLQENFCAVDSTVIEDRGNAYLLTLRLLKAGGERLMLFPVNDGRLGQGWPVAENDSNVRPAGQCFFWNEKKIRPGQDCSESYGCALNFYEITQISSVGYAERLVKKIYPAEVCSDLRNEPKGIHTYNMNDIYEVIDFKGYETDWLFYLMRPVWWLFRKIKHLFGKG